MFFNSTPVKNSVLYLSPTHSVAFAGAGGDAETVLFTSSSVMSKERTDAFSVGFYVKFDTVQDTRFVAKIEKSGNYRGWTFQLVSGALRLRLLNTVFVNELEVSVAWTPSTATWYYIGFTYSGNSNVSGCKIYIDAVSQTLTTVRNFLSATIINSEVLEMGGASPSDFFLQGNLCWASFWNKELSGAEVTELYNAGTPIDPRSSSAAANLEEFVPFGTGDTYPNLVGKKQSWTGVMTNMASGDIEADVP